MKRIVKTRTLVLVKETLKRMQALSQGALDSAKGAAIKRGPCTAWETGCA